MLAKQFKIASSERIKYILAKGCGVRGRYIQLKYRPNNKNLSRFCVIASGKLLKTAVLRNKLRRRLYEAIRHNWRLQTKTCFDIVVLCLKPSVKALYAELEQDLIACFKKLPHE